jgi:steroid delta-isomerase-like uncharacterized protein
MLNTTSETAIDTNKQIIRALYQDCLNRGQLDLLDDLVTPGFLNPNGEQGASAFRRNIEELRSAFPDIQFKIEDLIAAGDRVAVRSSWLGTHKGIFRGIPASGKQVTDTGITIYRFEDGRLAQAWLQTDRLGVLQQIGIIPADRKVGTAHKPVSVI